MIDVAILDTLVSQGVLSSKNVTASPLSGGVSCEIILLESDNESVVVKRALEKLKVKDDWFADVGRNKVEQNYLRYVDAFLPGIVPKIYYCDDEQNYFVMEMLGGDLENWKTRLLDDKFDQAYAVEAGSALGKIHEHSLGDRDAQAMFATLENFKQLRLEPYLLKTAERNPELSDLLIKEVERLASTQRCLVHGDYSPKNILVSPERLGVLDCEVAWYGDPVFDVAFYLNHFLLKAALKRDHCDALLDLAEQAWQAYSSAAPSIVNAEFEQQLCHLLPMLMLARVDGKSPVEYLNSDQQKIVKDFVYDILLTKKPVTLSALLTFWQGALKG
ncbi:phosphotransferase family protein [Agaribacterium sp. ZY112]|uniref:phosphotransferase family protein n=1 Tax=Agaribacterium sp. ZY112 TaxID=3233574 RepID=UPI00352442EB